MAWNRSRLSGFRTLLTWLYAASGSSLSSQSALPMSHQLHSRSLGTLRAGSGDTIFLTNAVTFWMKLVINAGRWDRHLAAVAVHDLSVEGPDPSSGCPGTLGTRYM